MGKIRLLIFISYKIFIPYFFRISTMKFIIISYIFSYTIIKGFKIAPCDIYIFTSPSNVAGFLMENEVPTQAKIIAWGASTQEALTQKGFKVNYTLKESSIESLIEYWLEISLI